MEKVFKRAEICCTVSEATGDSFFMELKCINMREPNSIKFHFENLEELTGTCNYIIGLAQELKEKKKEKSQEKNTITLEQLKARPINPETVKMFERTMELWHGNICAMQNRMAMGGDEVEYLTYEMTHDGNDIKSSEQMLDDARLYIEKHVYTDEQWEQYFIPAINKMLEYNANFVRFMPGYLIRHKETGQTCIVEGDYATLYGHITGRECRTYRDISVYVLDKDGNIEYSIAWKSHDDFWIVDSEHTKEHIAKAREYNKAHKHKPPYHMSQKMIDLFF